MEIDSDEEAGCVKSVKVTRCKKIKKKQMKGICFNIIEFLLLLVEQPSI